MAKSKREKKGKGKGPKNKGTSFERDVCKQLSLWWTDNERDDVFWRTSGSGARATQRTKLYKTTINQYGDVQAVDPIGQPFVDLCTSEIKKGYGDKSYFDMIEKLPTVSKKRKKKRKPSTYIEFISQARQQAEAARTKYWLLITKRDYKATMICMPFELRRVLSSHSDIRFCHPSAVLRTDFAAERVYVTTLDMFFKRVRPEELRALNYDRRQDV